MKLALFITLFSLSSFFYESLISFEGMHSKKGAQPGFVRAYKDPIGIWTIGVGHTKGVTPNMVISLEEANNLLNQDCQKFAKHVASLQPELKAWEFESLVSFAFNTGSIGGNLKKAVLRKDTDAVVYWLNKYVNAGGKPLRGLIKRRAFEARWYKGDFKDKYSI